MNCDPKGLYFRKLVRTALKTGYRVKMMKTKRAAAIKSQPQRSSEVILNLLLKDPVTLFLLIFPHF